MASTDSATSEPRGANHGDVAQPANPRAEPPVKTPDVERLAKAFTLFGLLAYVIGLLAINV
jgi:hypothetical protein